MAQFKLTSSIQMLLHVVTLITGTVLSLESFIPEKYRTTIMLTTGAIQAAIGYLGNQVNPDGTPAKQEYIKKPKKIKVKRIHKKDIHHDG